MKQAHQPFRFHYTVSISIHIHLHASLQGFDPATLLIPGLPVSISFHKNDKNPTICWQLID
ncbi:hypothetical protein AWT69_004036 [Pseudomonas putida]|nr:hypothetical protein AWT69_004036 [Pseudomonas putida]